MKEPSSVHCYNHDKLIDKFVLQNECTRHLSSQVSRAMGEAGKEHQALLLHCAVEVAGNAEPCWEL